MSRIRLRPPSPAMVVALLALFIALGGSGYAVTKLKSTKIRYVRNSIPGPALKNNSVTGKKVRESSLRGVLSCPDDTQAYESLCFETTARPIEAWFAASDTCADAGRRLPTVAELRPFRRVSGITLENEELTADRYYDDGLFGFLLLSDDGVLRQSNPGEFDHPYRCVVNPSD